MRFSRELSQSFQGYTHTGHQGAAVLEYSCLSSCCNDGMTNLSAGPETIPQIHTVLQPVWAEQQTDQPPVGWQEDFMIYMLAFMRWLRQFLMDNFNVFEAEE